MYALACCGFEMIAAAPAAVRSTSLHKQLYAY
jgi:hypothetical protein